jgi:ATP-binding cassette subfamily C protein
MFERARPILETLPETSDAKGEPGGLTGNIEISHAFFRYRPDTPLVLRDLSLSVRPGEFVALVGASGCGKSTLFRLLLGFDRLDSGAIHFDGQDLAGMNPQAVRRQIGVVLQNGQLQTGDIFENIAGTRPLTIDDAWAAASLAGLEDDIRAMPMGMHTVISEGGGGLSGGQRQRLMIARAIASRPRILLFDEATSALDNLTQAIVSRSLEQLEATRIVIAHRLSTIVKADRIFVLEAGRVVQSGSYAELIAQEGLFAKLAQRQLA